MSQIFTKSNKKEPRKIWKNQVSVGATWLLIFLGFEFGKKICLVLSHMIWSGHDLIFFILFRSQLYPSKTKSQFVIQVI